MEILKVVAGVKEKNKIKKERGIRKRACVRSCVCVCEYDGDIGGGLNKLMI